MRVIIAASERGVLDGRASWCLRGATAAVEGRAREVVGAPASEWAQSPPHQGSRGGAGDRSRYTGAITAAAQDRAVRGRLCPSCWGRGGASGRGPGGARVVRSNWKA